MEQAYRILYLGALLLLGAGILFGLIRAIRGPRTADRIMGINMIGTIAWSIFGVFRFRFVLNRMHCAAIIDTLGAMLLLLGLIVSAPEPAYFWLSAIPSIISRERQCTVNRPPSVRTVIVPGVSVIMSVLWALLRAPDLAVTEAAVGAGISSVLLFLTLRKLRDLKRKHADETEEKHS